MAALYQDTFWYPTGALAASIQARVFPRHINVLATLWQDAAETIPQPNPVTTSVAGVLSFYAAPGDYWIFIAGQSHPVSIDGDGVIPDVWHEVYQHVQAVASVSWMINHNLNANPDVSVVIGGQYVPGVDVQFTSLNSLTINFGTPQSGTATLRR